MDHDGLITISHMNRYTVVKSLGCPYILVDCVLILIIYKNRTCLEKLTLANDVRKVAIFIKKKNIYVQRRASNDMMMIHSIHPYVHRYVHLLLHSLLSLKGHLEETAT